LTESLEQRCLPIELLLVDVDGVLTDGRIIYSDAGAELKEFHVRDGSGLKFWLGQGKKAGIITGRRSPVVERRARELGLDVVIQGADDKRAALQRVLHELEVTAAQACYVGDDVPDVPLLRDCGLGVAVADACAEARAAADYITSANGGRGAVREVVELLLRAQGRWPTVLSRYQA
jgi:3-deoxy-D-manno-octulosonate 8-phosphate phosphatase (KDO 8-P phosphatase)